MDHQLRRRALAARLDDLSIDALLITRLLHTRYLTGFTGSNGQVLVRRDGALFLTDGRYTEQSRREVPDLERVTYLNPLREELAGYLDAARYNLVENADIVPGFKLTLDTGEKGYWFEIADKTDACGFRYISNQNGLIFVAQPIR